MHSFAKSSLSRSLSILIILTLICSLVLTPSAGYAQFVSTGASGSILNLPIPGTMVMPTDAFVPVMLKGMTIHPENPLKFDFIMDSGNTEFEQEDFKSESSKLIKYFLASLTVPQNELWVNLSPHEKNRIIPEALGQTELGQDLLAQDYILKQLTASLMYPEDELGAKFWDKIYKQAQEQYGTTDLPLDTFNKVWIIPESASVYEHNNTVYVVNSRLKVLTDADYKLTQEVRRKKLDETKNASHAMPAGRQVLRLTSDVIKNMIIPAIEKEVNEGENFAPLRQIYQSLILAKWYKETLKDSILSKVYVNQNKTEGINNEDPAMKEKIYEQYMQAYKKGVYDYMKNEYDSVKREIIPRKYFSGGFKDVSMAIKREDTAMATQIKSVGDYSSITVELEGKKEGRTVELPFLYDEDYPSREMFMPGEILQFDNVDGGILLVADNGGDKSTLSIKLLQELSSLKCLSAGSSNVRWVDSEIGKILIGSRRSESPRISSRVLGSREVALTKNKSARVRWVLALDDTDEEFLQATRNQGIEVLDISDLNVISQFDEIVIRLKEIVQSSVLQDKEIAFLSISDEKNWELYLDEARIKVASQLSSEHYRKYIPEDRLKEVAQWLAKGWGVKAEFYDDEWKKDGIGDDIIYSGVTITPIIPDEDFAMLGGPWTLKGAKDILDVWWQYSDRKVISAIKMLGEKKGRSIEDNKRLMQMLSFEKFSEIISQYLRDEQIVEWATTTLPSIYTINVLGKIGGARVVEVLQGLLSERSKDRREEVEKWLTDDQKVEGYIKVLPRVFAKDRLEELSATNKKAELIIETIKLIEQRLDPRYHDLITGAEVLEAIVLEGKFKAVVTYVLIVDHEAKKLAEIEILEKRGGTLLTSLPDEWFLDFKANHIEIKEITEEEDVVDVAMASEVFEFIVSNQDLVAGAGIAVLGAYWVMNTKGNMKILDEWWNHSDKDVIDMMKKVSKRKTKSDIEKLIMIKTEATQELSKAAKQHLTVDDYIQGLSFSDSSLKKEAAKSLVRMNIPMDVRQRATSMIREIEAQEKEREDKLLAALGIYEKSQVFISGIKEPDSTTDLLLNDSNPSENLGIDSDSAMVSEVIDFLVANKYWIASVGTAAVGAYAARRAILSTKPWAGKVVGAREIIENPKSYSTEKVKQSLKTVISNESLTKDDIKSLQNILSIDNEELRKFAEGFLTRENKINGYIKALPEIHAIEALGEIGGARAIAALQSVLSEKFDITRKVAEKYLTDEQKVEGYANALPKIYAINDLGKIGGARAIELLQGILSDKDKTRRETAEKHLTAEQKVEGYIKALPNDFARDRLEELFGTNKKFKRVIETYDDILSRIPKSTSEENPYKREDKAAEFLPKVLFFQEQGYGYDFQHVHEIRKPVYHEEKRYFIKHEDDHQELDSEEIDDDSKSWDELVVEEAWREVVVDVHETLEVIRGGKIEGKDFFVQAGAEKGEDFAMVSAAMEFFISNKYWISSVGTAAVGAYAARRGILSTKPWAGTVDGAREIIRNPRGHSVEKIKTAIYTIISTEGFIPADIKSLKNILSNDNEELRELAERYLTRENKIKGYTKALSSSNPKVIVGAIERLVSLEDDSSVELLIGHLGSKYENVRKAVKKALDKLKVPTERLVNEYMKLLFARNIFVKVEAAETLINMDVGNDVKQKAQNVLQEIERKKERKREIENRFKSLKRNDASMMIEDKGYEDFAILGSPWTLAGAREILDNYQEYSPKRILSAVEMVGDNQQKDEEDIKRLKSLLPNDKDEIRNAVKQYFTADEIIDEYIKILPNNSAIKELGNDQNKGNDIVVDALLGVLSDNPDLVTKALRKVSNRGDKKVINALLEKLLPEYLLDVVLVLGQIAEEGDAEIIEAFNRQLEIVDFKVGFIYIDGLLTKMGAANDKLEEVKKTVRFQVREMLGNEGVNTFEQRHYLEDMFWEAFKVEREGYDFEVKNKSSEEGNEEAISQRGVLDLKIVKKDNINDTSMAVEAPGGIDMNEIKVERRGDVGNIQFDTNVINEVFLNNIEGFAPVIINIAPIHSIFPLLGLAIPEDQKTEEISQDMPEGIDLKAKLQS